MPEDGVELSREEERRRQRVRLQGDAARSSQARSRTRLGLLKVKRSAPNPQQTCKLKLGTTRVLSD